MQGSEQFKCARDEVACQTESRHFIWQPYIVGSAISVAAVISQSRRDVEVFPPAEQHLSDDGRFRYQGGSVPLQKFNHAVIQTTALAACRLVPGLCGYVGIDLIVPDESPSKPIVVEINPRLTTSYLGYRALAENNLAEWMLIPTRFERGICWRDAVVEFDAEGMQ